MLQVRLPIVLPVPQQASPAAPQASQVPVRHTAPVAQAFAPLPQQDLPTVPQAVQVPVLLLFAPVHSVFAATHSLLPLVPQHG